MREAIFHITSRLRDSVFSNSMKNSITKSSSALTTERIYHRQSDNPLSIGSHQSVSNPPTNSSSLHRRSEDSFLSGSHSSVNYSRPVGTDPYVRPEDPFPDRFNPSAGYSPNFGRRFTMDHSDISHYLTEVPSRLWASPVCLISLYFPILPFLVYISTCCYSHSSSTHSDFEHLCFYLISVADIHSFSVASSSSKRLT